MVQAGGALAELAAPLAHAVKVSGAHIIQDLLRPEHAEAIADRLDEASRQLRLWAVRFGGRCAAVVDEEMAAAVAERSRAAVYDHGLPVGTWATGLSYRTGARAVGPILDIGPAVTGVHTDAGRIEVANDSVEPAAAPTIQGAL
jgi:hypothetical protein